MGFDQVGIAPAVPPPGYPNFLSWLEAGHAAGMGYMERGAEARAHPEHVSEGVRSVVVVSFVYGRPEPTSPTETQGKVARYARGADYHRRALGDGSKELLDWLKAERLHPEFEGRAVADTAPLLERDFARLAGLGWIGKNTMLIDRRLGSFTVLGALLVDCELKYDEPHVSSHCGTCTRCLDACPTSAFVGPGQLDARRCLSYWTIEHKGPIADEFAGRLDDWVFGCDICQEVCPWNRKAPAGRGARHSEPALPSGPTPTSSPGWRANPRRSLSGRSRGRRSRVRSARGCSAMRRWSWAGVRSARPCRHSPPGSTTSTRSSARRRPGPSGGSGPRSSASERGAPGTRDGRHRRTIPDHGRCAGRSNGPSAALEPWRRTGVPALHFEPGESTPAAWLTWSSSAMRPALSRS